MKNRTRKPRRVFSAFRLPSDLANWLRSAAEVRGKTKTRLVVEALRTKMALKDS